MPHTPGHIGTQGLDQRGFAFDAQEFASSRVGAEERAGGLEPMFLEDVVLPENLTLDVVEERAAELMAGRLPDDVQAEVNAQIEQITAERSLSQGLGLGQAALNLTFRDIGLNVFDVSQQGTALAAQIGEIRERSNLQLLDINTRRDLFNSEINLRYDTLTEEIRQWDDRFAAIMASTDLNVDELKLATFDLISTNQRFMQQMTNDLIIQNSRIEIEGGRDAIEDLQDFFFSTNQSVLESFGLES